jgi:hypothetical protein
VGRERLDRILARLFDSGEFLSPYGLRSLSRYHARQPFSCYVGGHPYTVSYEPAESTTDLFGGNSNWRGPIWFPINYLMIEALRKYHDYYGDTFKVNVPRGSERHLTLDEASRDLARRLTDIFLPARTLGGRRPVFGAQSIFQRDAHWRDYLLFYEYFHGDSGAGLGASHQTGWTALVANLIQDCGGADL